MNETDSKEIRPGREEAICFTAGLRGAAFGAGAVHAWLASDRLPPLVAAGTSTGALTAAAMRKCYQDLESAPSGKLERSRWTWFRRYLDTVTVSPFDVLWKSFPDPVDFFADKPPVRDLSTALLPVDLRRQAEEARRHYHILTKFGVWLAGLPVRVGTLACIVVYYVRFREGYGSRLLSLAMLCLNSARAGFGLWWHLLRSPKFFSERSFRCPFWRPNSIEKRWILPLRPLVGWPIWLAALLIPAALAWVAWRVSLAKSPLAALAVETTIIVAGAYFFARSEAVRWLLPRHLLRKLDLTSGLLRPFELKRRIHELFGEDKLSPRLSSGRELHALMVSAVLQQSDQVWPNEDVRLVEALTAALAVPGIFPPATISAGKLANYKGTQQPQVIDGVAVRNNPIPAFFEWCKLHPEIARRLEDSSRASLHVVYNVPIRQEGSVADAPPRESIDIVEAAQVSLALQERRDTRQEVRQTNYIAGLERYRLLAADRDAPDAVKHPRFQILADEIAPNREISFSNAWEPGRQELLRLAAEGCRESLETLYREELGTMIGERGGTVVCAELLHSLCSRRKQYIRIDTPGLPEICGVCPRVLRHRPPHDENKPPAGIIRSYGQPGNGSGVPLRSIFPHLAGDRPRIVFLGNGGVFRGAFHIGVIAAMKATRVFPDLVVGASVGMLMGGALAAISVADPAGEDHILEDLVATFLHVDEKVALTSSLKNAAKQLGIRARQVRLSPSEVRRKVLSGSRADPGFAATGAPPALIDAISSLFMIPHRRTAALASQFVAGHISQATNRFLSEVRKETLTSLGVEHSLIGVSLLGDSVAKLLGRDLKQVRPGEVQPWHYPANGKRPVSVFGTTSFLNARIALLLGRDFLTSEPTWDSVYAGLSSSAFPGIFSPRSEADVLPGRGRSDRLFADGGLFDNLPFYPAIEVLAAVQTSEVNPGLDAVLDRLRTRTEHRDVFIAAALDASPVPGGEYDTLLSIRSRARTLSANSKAASFDANSRQAQEALEEIVEGSTRLLDRLHPDMREPAAHFLDSVVSAAVLKVLPADKDHVNPTFAFCRATGLKQETVGRSIGDGCYQTLRQFIQSWELDSTVHRAFEGTAVASGLRFAPVSSAGAKECPFFAMAAGRLRCPFSSAGSGDVREIHQICANDAAHRRSTAA